MKKILNLLLAMFLFCGCSQNTTSSLSGKIYKDAKFDCADLDLNEDDFTNAGFKFGDSLDVEFSNGYKIIDVPYYNGYYVKTGEPVVAAYPNNDYVVIANNNADLWSIVGLKDGVSATLALNTKKKYLKTQEALGQDYSLLREEFDSDEQFTNFRSLKGGSLKENLIYRGASPVDNSRNRASYANALIEEAGINCIVDLADSDEDMQNYFASATFNSDYAKKLYEEGNTIVLSMSSDIYSIGFKQGIKKAVEHMLNHSGPYYIHCMEGKDRTGFVCLILEALAGASYDEMCADYMTTYANYYGITKEGTPEKYQAIVSLYFNTFLENITDISDDDQLIQLSYTHSAIEYLLECDLSDDEINQLIDLISE